MEKESDELLCTVSVTRYGPQSARPAQHDRVNIKNDNAPPILPQSGQQSDGIDSNGGDRRGEGWRGDAV